LEFAVHPLLYIPAPEANDIRAELDFFNGEFSLRIPSVEGRNRDFQDLAEFGGSYYLKVVHSYQYLIRVSDSQYKVTQAVTTRTGVPI